MHAAFRKQFYRPVPEIAGMSEEDVDQYKAELENIKTRGKDVPRPIKSWGQTGVSSKALGVLKKLNYETPTPIQAQAIPVIMSGRDMLGIAKTGCGKTLAFLLPLLRHVMDQPRCEQGDVSTRWLLRMLRNPSSIVTPLFPLCSPPPRTVTLPYSWLAPQGCIGLIMSPTRELALQIYNEARRFCKHLGLRVTCLYGGSDISDQISLLKSATEIIVCTPGRMIDMLTVNSGRITNLRRCTYVALDEADRMFDMGFEPQVMRILDNIRPDRQTVMFSATFPRAMEALARKILAKPIEVRRGCAGVQVGGGGQQHDLSCDVLSQSVTICLLATSSPTPALPGHGGRPQRRVQHRHPARHRHEGAGQVRQAARAPRPLL